MKKHVSTIRNKVRSALSPAALILIIAIAGMVLLVIIREAVYADAQESTFKKSEQKTLPERQSDMIEPYIFSQAAQFELNDSHSVLEREIALTSIQSNPFAVTFSINNTTSMTFRNEGDIREIGGQIYKLSQIAPYKGAARYMIHTVLLVGEL